MGRRGRPGPPLPDDRWIHRPRLLRETRRRFEVRVVAVVGGAGIGKTTLLAQSLEANRIAPMGTDLWLPIGRDDADGRRLVEDLAALVDRPAPAVDLDEVVAPAIELAAHVARTFPHGVALVVDDAHRLPEGSPGAAVLRTLVHESPPPVRFLIATRRPIPWLARLRARAEVVDVGERALCFTDPEIAELATELDADPGSLGGTGGWPALTRLAASLGFSGAAAFAEEEVVARLDETSRRRLAAVAATGGGDAGVLLAATGGHLDPDALAAELPLVEMDGEGGLRVHEVWRRLLAGVLTREEEAAARARVGSLLLERGELTRAADLLARAGDWEGFRRAVTAAHTRGRRRPAFGTLSAWLALLPEERHDSPEGFLLRGGAAGVQDSFGARPRDLLAAAAEGFQLERDPDGELAALGGHVSVCRARGERDQLGKVASRLRALRDAGCTGAGPCLDVVLAARADVVGDDDAVLVHLDRAAHTELGPVWSGLAAHLRLVAAERLGDGQEALAAAGEWDLIGGSPRSGPGFRPLVAWWAGYPEEALAALTEEHAGERGTRVEQLFASARGAVVCACAGDPERARANLQAARSALVHPKRPETAGEVAAAAAASAIASGDEGAGAATLAELLGSHPFLAGGERGLRVHLALPYVLLPETRPEWDGMELRGVLARQREVARAVVGVRGERPETDPAHLPSADEVIASVPLPWASELAAWAAAQDHPAGRALADRLVALLGDRARRSLRRLARDGSGEQPTRARGARRLLGEVSVRPDAVQHLDLLGSVELHRGGRPVDHPDWDRELVRALAAYLALEGGATREATAAALWPDQARSVAARNLRVHLTHLHRVLEPDRRRGEASFQLRRDDERVELAGEPHLSVDEQRFESLLSAAEESERDPRGETAVELLREALALWRGEPLTGLPGLIWVEAHRERLRSRFVAASLRLGELLVASGDARAAVPRAIDALQVDPWSEPAYQLLVAAHLAAGDDAAARRGLERCRHMLDELGVPSALETQMLARRLAESS